MAIVTTYVCDVTGRNGTNREDFIDVEIKAREQEAHQYSSNGFRQKGVMTIQKLIHRDVAAKLNLLSVAVAEAEPEVSFEGKLKTLLKDYVADLVQDHLDNQP